MKTPNALPPGILLLGERFKNAAITAQAAKTITHIDSITIGKHSKEKDKYPYHLVDIWYHNGNENRILVRSRELRINRKQLRAFMREIIRKVAVFIFETKNL